MLALPDLKASIFAVNQLKNRGLEGRSTAHEGIAIEFRDPGVGITEDNQKQIFSGFFLTQPTEAYMSKETYALNADGSGGVLFRIKTFEEGVGPDYQANKANTKFQIATFCDKLVTLVIINK